MKIERLLEDNRLSRALLGLNSQELKALEKSFEASLRQAQKARHPNRQRALGAGQKGFLPETLNKLVFILVYLKCYPTFDLQGILFGHERSRACRWVHFLMPVLETALGRECVLPSRQIRSLEEFFRAFPDAKDLFLDGTERPIQKPKSPKRRRKTYSGKKKQTTRKMLIMSDDKRRIGFLSKSKSGRRHDKRLLDKADLLRHIPKDKTLWVDTGFQGSDKQHGDTQLPKKSTKKNPLNPEQKQNNKTISGLRSVVEHAIGGMKRLACMAHIYRNRKPNVDDQFALLSAGIWNFHLRMV